jgi:hypothetical protein
MHVLAFRQPSVSCLARLSLITPSGPARADWLGEDPAPSTLSIDELAEDSKRLDCDPWLLGLLVHCTHDRIHHPFGQHAARRVRQGHDDVHLPPRAMPTDQLHLASVQRVVAI